MSATRSVLVLFSATILFLACSDPTRPAPTSPEENVRNRAGTEDAQSARPARRRAVASPSSAGALLGSWGGEHIALQLLSGRGSVELDCAHGTINEAVVLAADGSFSARGTFTLEHGGPITQTDIDNTGPATYRGKVSGETMHLTISLDTGELTEKFVLVRNQPARVVKCL